MVHFISLYADEGVLLARAGRRKRNQMKSSLVRAQMEALERPNMQEQGKDVIEVDCSRSLIEVQRKVLGTVRELLANDQ